MKTLGRRNNKPTANREVEKEYIQHYRTPRIENEAREIPGIEMQRKQQVNVRAD